MQCILNVCVPGLQASANTNTNTLKTQIQHLHILNVYLVCRASGTEDLELVARLVDVLQAHL